MMLANQMGPSFIQSMIQNIDIYEKYDAEVQAVLDEYWPGITDLQSIKRNGFSKNVYKANYNGLKVSVKSVPYDPTLE